jgi:hypothetical protein
MVKCKNQLIQTYGRALVGDPCTEKLPTGMFVGDWFKVFNGIAGVVGIVGCLTPGQLFASLVLSLFLDLIR